MKKIFLVCLLLNIVFTCVPAQITIGSGLEPLKGAILDLKEDSENGKTSTKGLMLPRVRLQEIYSLQMDETASKLEGQELPHAGLMVYNVNDSYPICKGVYIWNGNEWITPTPCNIPPQGFGILSGKMCYDVVENDAQAACGAIDKRKSQKVDFSDRTIQDPKTGVGIPISGTSKARYSGVQVYTFTASEAVDNVSFFYKNPTGVNVIEKIEWDKTQGEAGLAKGEELKATVYFNKSLNSLVKGYPRTNSLKPQIAAVFIDKASNSKFMQEISPSIQDCACCGAVSTNNSGWIEFMCHDLGADESVDPLTHDPSQRIYGDLYQWGRPKDGHEKRNSLRTSQKAQDMDDLLTNPDIKGKFIKTYGAQDWIINPPAERWTKTHNPNYDPCPEGWHVSSKEDMESILGPLPLQSKILIPPEGIEINGNFIKYTDNEGLQIGDLLYFPFAGFKGCISGQVFDTEKRFQFWLNKELENIIVSESGGDMQITFFHQANTSFAHSVRCIAD